MELGRCRAPVVILFAAGVMCQDAMRRHLLVLTVGYGQGHHAAAEGLAEEFSARGWSVTVADPCAAVGGRLFRATQAFYRLCVRRAPWLWGITYAQTDTADWSRVVAWPPLRRVTVFLGQLLQKLQPDLVVCTYPLYAYMLDWLGSRGQFHGRYAVVVTDAREISRPWMLSQAPLVCLTDRESAQRVSEHYALPHERLAVTGFPVRQGFSPRQAAPKMGDLLIVYGAFRSTGTTEDDVRAIVGAFPWVRMIVLAGGQTQALQHRLHAYTAQGRLCIVESCADMAALLSQAHVYVGKAGAATLFECYSALVPVFVRFALPGQEQGNLELLTEDGAGIRVDSSAELVEHLGRILEHNGARWNEMRCRMRREERQDGARRTADALVQHFFS